MVNFQKKYNIHLPFHLNYIYEIKLLRLQPSNAESLDSYFCKYILALK